MTPTNNTPTAALWYSPIQKEFLKIQLGDGSNLNGIDCPLLKDGGMLGMALNFTTEEYDKKSFKKCSFID